MSASWIPSLRDSPKASRAKRLYGYAAAQSFEPASSVFDIFDWEFKKYLTPQLLPPIWILSLGIASLQFIQIVIVACIGSVPASERLPRYVDEWLYDDVNLMVLLDAAKSTAIVLVVLLGVRVSAEAAVVLFNMGGMLFSIDDRASRDHASVVDGDADSPPDNASRSAEIES